MTTSKNVMMNSQVSMWWFPVVVVSIIVLGTIFVLWPHLSGLKDSIAKSKTVEAQLIRAQAKVEQVNKINVDQLDNLTTLAAKALPEHKPFFEVMVTLQQLAMETGIHLQDFKLDPGLLATESTKKTSKDNTDFDKLQTQLTISGTIETVSQFVERLHQALPLITVTSIGISKNESLGGNEEGRSARLDLNLYFAKPIKDTGKISLDPLPQFSESQQSVLTALADYNSALDATSSTATFPDFERTDVFTF